MPNTLQAVPQCSPASLLYLPVPHQNSNPQLPQPPSMKHLHARFTHPPTSQWKGTAVRLRVRLPPRSRAQLLNIRTLWRGSPVNQFGISDNIYWAPLSWLLPKESIIPILPPLCELCKYDEAERKIYNYPYNSMDLCNYCNILLALLSIATSFMHATGGANNVIYRLAAWRHRLGYCSTNQDCRLWAVQVWAVQDQNSKCSMSIHSTVKAL